MDKYQPPHSATRFSQLTEELCNILYERTQNKTKINTLVDQLNAMNYKSGCFVALHDATSMITAICLNVQPADSFLSAKMTHLLNSILLRQNLQLNKMSVHQVIAWDLQCLEACSSTVILDILHNLNAAIFHNTNAAGECIEKLVGNDGIFLRLIEQTDEYLDKAESQHKKLDIILLTFKCLVSLTVHPEESRNKEKAEILNSDVLQAISDVVIKFLYKGYNKTLDEFVYCKVVVHALRILSQIYMKRHEDINIPLPEVIGLSKHFLLYGLVADAMPQKIAASQQTIAQPVVQNSRGGKKQKVRKQRNSAVEGLKKEIPTSDRSLTNGLNNFEGEGYKPASQSSVDPIVKPAGYPITSDSDMSDVESGKDAKLVALKTRVRQSASNLLLVLIKITEKKDMFGYWWALLPDSPNADAWSEEEPTKRTLAYCAVNDPMSIGRAGSLSAVLALLTGSRIYLSQAEISKQEITSFTPFSIRLGHTITCLHRVLCCILETERVAAVAMVALKCCAALVQATPYHRMQGGLVSDVVRVSRSYLMRRDATMQVTALAVTGCVLSVDPAIDEILRSVQKDTATSASYKSICPQVQPEQCDDFEEGYSDDEDIFTAPQDNKEEEVPYFSSWVLDVCFKNLGWVFRDGEILKCRQSAIPLMLESLQVIAAIAFHHFPSILQPHVKLLADVFSSLLESHHVEVILQTSRVASAVADAMVKLEQSQPGLPALSDCTYFWEKLLSSPLLSILQGSDNFAAKAVACDCIANIGQRVFKELPRRLQVLCVALLSGSCSDEEAAVRAGAVRALAMCALYRDLREDPCFVSDCGESVLRLVHDPALAVRVKASWSLGNLSDALALNMNEPDIETVDNDLLLRLLEASIECSKENDKIKMSATRAIGNLLHLITEANMQRTAQLKHLAGLGLQRLVNCASKGGNMKIRWNACYAVGNALRNAVLYTALTDWQKPVLSCLCSLTQDCKNLKVRITAATALRSPTTRAQYAVQLASVWRAVLAAMEAANNVEDYTEYKHKDNLLEQLCVTLAHICCLLTPTDLPEVLDPLCFHFECAKSVLSQLVHKLPPEHESCLKILDAAKYVTVSLSAETESQRQALGMLQELFIWEP